MGKLRTLPSRLASLQPRLTQFAAGERGRAQASPWRDWYNTTRWRRLRLRIFERDGYTCQWPGCGHVEGDTSKLVADHRRPHRGDEKLFWDEENLETLCASPCHAQHKQRAEQRGAIT